MALGGGIWSMHFIGILAFTVLGRGRFDPWMTALSILASVAASWVALALLMRREISRTTLVVGGVLVGAGIGAMHYIGMEASQWAPIMRFDPWGFAASLLVAVLLAIGALWVRFGLERVVRWQARWLNLAAGAVMGLAIAAPHYVAMAALRFIDAPGELELATTVEGTSLALAVAAVALVIGGAGHRYQRRPALPADVPADATERVPPARHCRHGRGRHGDDRCAGAGAVLQRSGRTHPGLAPRGRGGPERVHSDARARPLPPRYLHSALPAGPGWWPDRRQRPRGAGPAARWQHGAHPHFHWPRAAGRRSGVCGLHQRPHPVPRHGAGAAGQRAAPALAHGQHTGRHLPLPLRRRLDHAVHQRCGDRTHGLVAAGLSGRPCQLHPAHAARRGGPPVGGSLHGHPGAPTLPRGVWPAGPRRATALGVGERPPRGGRRRPGAVD